MRSEKTVAVQAMVARALALALALALGGAYGCWPAMARVKPPHAEEYRLKAAFVYNLIPFVEWPADIKGNALVVCFAGEGGMEAALKAFFQGQNSAASGMEVRVARGRNEMRACNVLFLAYPDTTRMQKALSHLQAASVLTIGEGEEFVRMGGVIALAANENRLRLLVNPSAAQRAHLRISAKLLSMARTVPGEPGGKDCVIAEPGARDLVGAPGWTKGEV
jgi:YfiR/HmsC-like